MEKQTIRIHRVGTVTFGLVLVATGAVFLAHLLLPRLDYRAAFRFWPLSLITLGTEVLLGSRQKSFEIRDEAGKLLEENRVVYDVAAIVLTAALTVFSMFMGVLEWSLHYHYLY